MRVDLANCLYRFESAICAICRENEAKRLVMYLPLNQSDRTPKSWYSGFKTVVGLTLSSRVRPERIKHNGSGLVHKIKSALTQ